MLWKEKTTKKYIKNKMYITMRKEKKGKKFAIQIIQNTDVQTSGNKKK